MCTKVSMWYQRNKHQASGKNEKEDGGLTNSGLKGMGDESRWLITR